MTITAWLESAAADAERRGLPSLPPLLEALARSTSALRTADWNPDPTGLPAHRSSVASEPSEGGSTAARSPASRAKVER